ncbi:MAG: hypothetical protein CMI96_00245 [Pelagibacteraceae bacterium]|nr:hypothetical protein [Pelagibacteraceae bacterium]|tara:strand:+ start:49366 stop:49794 length:429 start_codon:yes stop_codon:yes gene_type:complete
MENKIWNIDTKLKIAQIDNHLLDISKQSITDEVINWFQQSSIHWMSGLFIMRYYFTNEELSKQLLVEEINKHIPLEGKKTVTTEIKYIDDAETKKFVIILPSLVDNRKRVIKPTDITINSFSNWFENYYDNLKNFFNLQKQV